jgi:hypothetical protein
LIARINQYLGGSTVRRIRFSQTMSPRPAVRVRPLVTEAAVAAAADAVSALPDGPLRSALAALGRAVLAETPSRLGYQPRTRY